MSNTEKTGGPVSPTNHHTTEEGMTLLDYFAGECLAKATQKPTSLYQWLRWAFGYSYISSTPDIKEVARYAYLQSAAMIEERKKHT